MARKNIVEFYRLVMKDKALKKQLADISKDCTVDNLSEEMVNNVFNEVVSIANSRGYDFTVDELVEYTTAELERLDMEDLSEIGGGVTPRFAAAGLLALTLSSSIASVPSSALPWTKNSEPQYTSVSSSVDSDYVPTEKITDPDSNSSTVSPQPTVTVKRPGGFLTSLLSKVVSLLPKPSSRVEDDVQQSSEPSFTRFKNDKSTEMDSEKNAEIKKLKNEVELYESEHAKANSSGLAFYEKFVRQLIAERKAKLQELLGSITKTESKASSEEQARASKLPETTVDPSSAQQGSEKREEVFGRNEGELSKKVDSVASAGPTDQPATTVGAPVSSEVEELVDGSQVQQSYNGDQEATVEEKQYDTQLQPVESVDEVEQNKQLEPQTKESEISSPQQSDKGQAEASLEQEMQSSKDFTAEGRGTEAPETTVEPISPQQSDGKQAKASDKKKRKKRRKNDKVNKTEHRQRARETEVPETTVEPISPQQSDGKQAIEHAETQEERRTVDAGRKGEGRRKHGRHDVASRVDTRRHNHQMQRAEDVDQHKGVPAADRAEMGGQVRIASRYLREINKELEKPLSPMRHLKRGEVHNDELFEEWEKAQEQFVIARGKYLATISDRNEKATERQRYNSIHNSTCSLVPKGIYNIGNTCHINSALQVFLNAVDEELSLTFEDEVIWFVERYIEKHGSERLKEKCPTVYGLYDFFLRSNYWLEKGQKLPPRDVRFIFNKYFAKGERPIYIIDQQGGAEDDIRKILDHTIAELTTVQEMSELRWYVDKMFAFAEEGPKEGKKKYLYEIDDAANIPSEIWRDVEKGKTKLGSGTKIIAEADLDLQERISSDFQGGKEVKSQNLIITAQRVMEYELPFNVPEILIINGSKFELKTINLVPPRGGHYYAYTKVRGKWYSVSDDHITELQDILLDDTLKTNTTVMLYTKVPEKRTKI